jgi:hypothetical protein
MPNFMQYNPKGCANSLAKVVHFGNAVVVMLILKATALLQIKIDYLVGNIAVVTVPTELDLDTWVNTMY